MSLWKRGNVYWSYIYVDGVRHSQSTGTGNLRQATTIEQRFRDELNLKRLQIVQPAPQTTFGELTARFLADGEPRPWHHERLKLLLPYWSEIPIGRINKPMTVDYRRQRHAMKHITDTTVNRDLQCMRHILFWAVDQGVLTTNPLARLRLVPERRKPRSIMTIEEEERLLAAAASHLQSIITVALDTGMRRGELLNQRWEHVDFNRRLLFVSKSKTAGGEGREIPMTERVHSLLLPIRQDEGLLFTFRNQPIHRIKTAWKSAIRRAAIRYFRFHDLRHAFNTRLLESGVQQEIRKALMGHSSGEDINSRYTHIEAPAKREAIRKLESWISQQQLTQTGGKHDSAEASGPSPAKVSSIRPISKEALEEENPRRGSSRPDQPIERRRS